MIYRLLLCFILIFLPIEANAQLSTMGTGGSGAAVPGFTLDFSQGTVPSGVTGSGATNGTRQNAAGNIVAATAPRIDYFGTNPSNLLVEPAVTNLILQSQAFNVSPWNDNQLNPTDNSTTSPDGTTDATKLVATGGGGALIGQSGLGLTTGLTYTYTGYFKAGTTNFVLFAPNDGSKEYGQLYNVSTCAFVSNKTDNSSPGTITASIPISVGNGWCLLSVTFVSTATNTGAYNVIMNTSGDGTYSSANTAGAYFYIWGAQVEQGGGSSYVPTTSATVTRSADADSFTYPSGLGGNLKYTFNDGTTQSFTGVAAGTIPISGTYAPTKSRIHTISGN